MATNAFPGFLSQIYIGTPPVRIAELKTVTLKVTADTIDVSSHASLGWKDFINGLKLWSLTADYLYIQGDSPQSACYSALINRVSLLFAITPKGDEAVAGEDTFTGTGIVNDWQATGPNTDAFAASISVQGQGALVMGAI